MSHKLLSAVSILPALLVMPALADVINLNEQYNNGKLKNIDNRDTQVSLTTDIINFDTDDVRAILVSGNDVVAIIGDQNTKQIDISAKKLQGAYTQLKGQLDMKASSIKVSSDGLYAAHANAGGNINIKGDDIDIKGIGVNGMALVAEGFYYNDEQLASHINVVGKNVKLSTDSTEYGAVYAQNKTTTYDGDLSSIKITADNIDIDAPNYGVLAFSQGIVELNGNTTIDAVNAIAARGNAQVNINTNGAHTTKINGNLAFDYHEGTSRTSIDALVNVVLAGADSYWNGNTIVSYDKKPTDETKLNVSNATITLKDGATWNATKITDNKGDQNGLFYTALNNLNIDNGTVNIADTTRGIAIDNANIKNGTFTGGHIQINKTATIADSEFKEHKHTGDGGAIYNAATTVIDSETAEEKTVYANTTVSDSEFVGNHASSKGGAVYNNGIMALNDVTFSQNSAYLGSAIYNDEKGVLTLKDTKYLDNQATGRGTIFNAGIITMSGDTLFENNDVRNNNNGGAASAIHNEKTGTITFNDENASLKFLNNTALSSGAVQNKGGGTLNFIAKEIVFDGNSAEKDHGGAMYNEGNVSFLAATNKFLNNHSDEETDAVAGGNKNNDMHMGGGAIQSRGTGDSVVTIGKDSSENIFDGNYATMNGGAILNRVDSAVVFNGKTTFSNNYTELFDGGAIYNLAEKGANPKITFNGDVLFDGNLAKTGSGGAIWNGTDGTDGVNPILEFKNGATFKNNYAKSKGGAVYNSGKDIKLENMLFENNSATGFDMKNGEAGGAIYNAGDMTISNATFKGNYAGIYDAEKNELTGYGDGGAVYTTDGTLTVTDSWFEGNKAAYDGALGVGTNGQYLVIKNTTFKNNSALSTGAVGIFAGPATLTDVDFIGNSATDATDDGAGALFLGSVSQTTVNNGQFVANKSASFGGAIVTRTAAGHNNSGATLDITDGVFSANSAATNGGAIYNAFYHSSADADADVGAVRIADTSFVGNTAFYGGGAIYNDGTADKAGNGGAMMLQNVQFIDNSATSGGAIYNTENANIEFNGENVFSDNRRGSLANDIYNDGSIVISGGNTTFDGGVLGKGVFTLADGATVNLGTGVIQQSQIDINGVVNADILNSRNYGRLFGDVVFGDNAELNLNVATTGTYKIFDRDNEFSGINAGALFDVQNNGAAGVVISAKAAETLASENGLSTQAAATLVGLANAGGALSGVSIAAQNALASGNVDYIESESAKAAPVNKPVTHSVSTTVQNQVLSLVASRMSGAVTGRSGGDFVTTASGMWAHGLINRSKMNGAFHGDTRGVAVGVDATFNRKYTFGMGYAYGDTDVHADVSKTDIESNTLFAYAQYKPNKWFVNGAFNYTFADYTDHTDLFGFNVSSDHSVDSYGAQLVSGYDFITGVTPSVGARYLHISQDGYNNGIAQVKSADTDFVTGVAELKYAFDINPTRALTLKPELRAAATYDFMSDESVATVLIPGAASYVVNSDRLSRFGGEFGIGMSALYRGVTVSVMYDLDLHQDYTSQTGMLKFRYNF